MVQTMINGVPTVTGWADWISAFTIMGLFGVSGGLGFWLIWRQRNKSAAS
jgi:LPXTG-motif cell wall-anchored protein